MIEFNFGLLWEYKGKKGGETLFHTAIADIKGDMGNWAPAFRLIAQEILAPFVEQQFASEGTAGDTKWRELAPSTVKERGSAHPILFRTGDLQHSFEEGGPGHEEDISKLRLVWGSRIPYALFHQTGTGARVRSGKSKQSPETGAGMPARPILVLTDAMKQRMRNTMVGRLSQIARQYGKGYAQSSGMETTALEARKIGQSILRG